MEEYNAVKKIVFQKLTRICKSNLGVDEKKGDMGELFCEYVIKQLFFTADHRISKSGIKSFTIFTHYPYGKSNIHGIDFKLDFIDKSGNSHTVFIEVKKLES